MLLLWEQTVILDCIIRDVLNPQGGLLRPPSSMPPQQCSFVQSDWVPSSTEGECVLFSCQRVCAWTFVRQSPGEWSCVDGASGLHLLGLELSCAVVLVLLLSRIYRHSHASLQSSSLCCNLCTETP